MPNLGEFTPYGHLFISVGLGLLVGLQREWAESPLAGIRTFTLITILGTVSALLAETYGAWFIGVMFISAISLALFIKKELSNKIIPHRGMVTEVSILIMFCVGIMVRTGPTLLAASLAVLVSVILQVKIELHSLVARFSRNEIRSIMQFMAISLLIFPVVPDRELGPGGILNLHHTWWIVILITGMSLMGQIINKFMPHGNGLIWTGIIGGIISSTVTTFSYSKNSKSFEKNAHHDGLIILTAWWTVYLRIFLELYVVVPNFSITLPLLVMSLVSGLGIVWNWRKHSGNYQVIPIPYNPTGLKTALSFAFFYSIIIYAFTYFKENAETDTLPFIAFISGIFDMDAITLSTGRLVQKGILNPHEGKTNFYIALIANLVAKGFMARLIGGRKLFSYLLIPWLVSVLFAILILISHSFYK